MNLSKSQKRVIKKLASGGYLDPVGKDELGGWCWNDGETGFRVSVRDMGVLLSNSLIELGDAWTPYKLTHLGYIAAGYQKVV